MKIAINTLKDEQIINIINTYDNLFTASKEENLSYTSLRRRVIKLVSEGKIQYTFKKDNQSLLSEHENKQHDNITAEECIEVLRDVQVEYPEKDISRNFFRHESNLADSDWTQHFGTFTEFKAQAGLSATRQVKAVERAIAKHVSHDHYEDLNYRHALGDLYLKESSGRYKTIVIGSDFHDEEADEFSLRMFLEACKLTNPDIVCLNGDIFDLPEFGRWGNDPRDWDVVARIKFAHENVLKKVREVAPFAQIDLIEGNHEARLLKHLQDQSPAMRAVLSDFLGLGVEDLFRLKELSINYVSKVNLKAWTRTDFKKELDKNFRVYFDSMVCHHFPQGARLGLPGVNGHHHSFKAETLYNYTSGSYTWIQSGAIHIRDASYCEGEKWSNGFVIAHVDTVDKKVLFEYVDTTNEVAVLGGKFYHR